MKHGVMELPLVICVERPAEHGGQRVVGAWEVHGMESDPVPEASVPEEDGLHAC